MRSLLFNGERIKRAIIDRTIDKTKTPSGYSPNGILFVTPQDNLRNLPSALNLRHQRNPFEKSKRRVYTDQ